MDNEFLNFLSVLFSSNNLPSQMNDGKGYSTESTDSTWLIVGVAWDMDFLILKVKFTCASSHYLIGINICNLSITLVVI